jgi:hypothetical protein
MDVRGKSRTPAALGVDHREGVVANPGRLITATPLTAILVTINPVRCRRREKLAIIACRSRDVGFPLPGRACSLDFSTIADVTLDGTLIGTSVLPSNAGHLFRILAVDGVQLKRSMFACWSVVRTAMTGRAPIKRRK